MNKYTLSKIRPLLAGISALILTGSGFSQNLTTSPYSRFGIGDLLTRSTGQGQAMGGLSGGLQSATNLNLLNPASLSALEKNADYGSFILEASTFERVSNLRTTNLSRTVNNLGFNYLALGFPVTKWWKASTGILPV